jgi:hypothetical protein
MKSERGKKKAIKILAAELGYETLNVSERNLGWKRKWWIFDTKAFRRCLERDEGHVFIDIFMETPSRKISDEEAAKWLFKEFGKK